MITESKIRKFESSKKDVEALERWYHLHDLFLQKFPFRKKPKEIDKLTQDGLYNPSKNKDYFSAWLEYKLKDVERLGVGDSSW